MRFFLSLAIALAFAASANATTFTATCNDLYPKSYGSTTAVAGITKDAHGNIIGLHCEATTHGCTITDGACCECNVKRGFTPECTVIVEHDDFETRGACINAFPACYYGDGCGSSDGAFLMSETSEPTVKRSKTKKPKKAKKSRR